MQAMHYSLARVSGATCVASCVVLLLLAGGCAPSDPLEAALAERAAWKVDVIRWLQDDDGNIVVSLRVGGPVHAELQTLTVRIELLDGDGGVLREDWRELKLSGISRGVTKELMMRLAPIEATIEG